MSEQGYRGNVLLVELIVVVLFFSLSAVISLGVFVQARTMTTQAEQITLAGELLQEQAEKLAAQRDAAACLLASGFAPEGEGYRLEREGVTLRASVAESRTAAGVRTRVTLAAENAKGETLCTLPAGGYFPEVSAP